MAVLRAWRNFYGDNPLHLLAMVGCFALVGYVVSFVYESPSAIALAIWFIGAVLGHDLVLYPLYALADQPLTIGRWARRKVLPRHPPRVPAINHIRVPVLGSAVVGLIYLPTIAQRGEDAFRFTSGLGTAAIYPNWLLITAVLFLGSAVVYAARLGASASRSVVARSRRPVAVGAATSPPEPEPAATAAGPAAAEPTVAEAPSPEPGPAAAEGTLPDPEPTGPEPPEPEPTADRPAAPETAATEAADSATTADTEPDAEDGAGPEAVVHTDTPDTPEPTDR